MNYNPIAKQYEDDILSGVIPSGKLLRLAIERHRKDLKNGHKRGLWFNHEAGQQILDFAELLNLGPELPFTLAPWLVWEKYVYYGWRRADGTRRFRFKYKSVARKNAKTPGESLEALFHLLFTDLFRAEVYVSATKEDQAKIAFDDAKTILEFSPVLQGILSASATSIFNSENRAKFQFLTSNPKTADGTRPSVAIIDEYHEFDNDDMIGKLQTGMIHRKEPILNIVTTRGTDKTKPCFQAELKMYIPILKGIVKDDSTFVLIYSLDEADDWQDPTNWIKANPMIGYILTLDNLKEAYRKAKLQGPEHLIKFKTLNLNMWCDAPLTWIEDEVWQAGAFAIKKDDFAGKECYGGLDLAKRDDFCSLCLTFPRKEGEETHFDSFWWHWIPQETVTTRVENGLSSLREWITDGYIIVTEGNVTDYDVIEQTIKELADTFAIVGVSYDQHNIGNLAVNLGNYGVEMNIMSQTMTTMSEPTKQLKYAILEGRFNHGFDPVMRWQVSNAVEISDNNDNIRITKDKKRAKEKVDGVIAAVIAMGEYITQTAADTSSIYDTRGFLEL